MFEKHFYFRRQTEFEYILIHVYFNDHSIFSFTNIPVSKINLRNEPYISKNLIDFLYFNKDFLIYENSEKNVFNAEINGLTPVYTILRSAPECCITLSVLQTRTNESPTQIYVDTKKKLEDLGIEILNQFADQMVNANIYCRNTFIMTNSQYRQAIIKKGYYLKKSLTTREIECMKFLAMGMPAKMIAKQMSINPLTVNVYIKKIKMKLGCKTIVDIAVESILRGLVGGLNYSLRYPFILGRKNIEGHFETS